MTELLSGRLTFALGLCFAALTALLLERRRTGLATTFAAVTALTSPVAGLFAVLAGLAGRRASVVAAALLPVAALAIAFPTGGYQPFAFGTLWPLLLVGGFILLLRPGRVLGAATVLYLVGCVAAYAIHTPVGSNAARLGELAAGPLVALLLALAALPLTYLQVHAAITDLKHGEPDSSAAYYRPLIAFLRREPGVWRVEVPPTQGHWESYWLATRFPLARGWERQTDIADDALFYEGGLTEGGLTEGGLTAARYDAWLHQLAVRYVAVADAAPDYSARAELRLIRSRPSYLHVIARLPHWTVYAVTDPSPIASGAGRVEAVGSSTLRLAITRAGAIHVRVRWSPYWQLSGVRGCVAPAGAFTLITTRGRGSAELRMSFSIARIDSRAPRCD